MQAKGGSRARGRRPGAVAVAVSITAGLLGLAGAPALAAPAVISTPAPTASIADGVALTVIVPLLVFLLVGLIYQLVEDRVLRRDQQRNSGLGKLS